MTDDRLPIHLTFMTTEVLGLARLLWELGGELQDQGDPACLHAEAFADASFWEEVASFPAWPTSENTRRRSREFFSRFLAVITGAESDDAPLNGRHAVVACQVLARDVAATCQLLWRLGDRLENHRSRAFAWEWAYQLEIRLPQRSWALARPRLSFGELRARIEDHLGSADGAPGDTT